MREIDLCCGTCCNARKVQQELDDIVRAYDLPDCPARQTALRKAIEKIRNKKFAK